MLKGAWQHSISILTKIEFLRKPETHWSLGLGLNPDLVIDFKFFFLIPTSRECVRSFLIKCSRPSINSSKSHTLPNHISPFGAVWTEPKKTGRHLLLLLLLFFCLFGLKPFLSWDWIACSCRPVCRRSRGNCLMHPRRSTIRLLICGRAASMRRSCVYSLFSSSWAEWLDIEPRGCRLRKYQLKACVIWVVDSSHGVHLFTCT